MSTARPVIPRPHDGRPGTTTNGTVIWVQPRLPAPSGGTVYNDQVAEALVREGVDVRRIDLAGPWPRTDEAALQQVRERIAEARRGLGRHPVVVDGLVGGGLPGLFVADGAEPAADILLVHLPLGAERVPDAASLDAVEGRAVRRAPRVVTTSRWAAEELRRRHGRRTVDVIAPGTAPAPEARCPRPEADAAGTPGAGSSPPRLTVAASLTPRKNHRLLAEALEPLLDREWILQLAGPGAEAPHGAAVLAELRRRLPGRIDHRGALPPTAMPALWERTDLLLLPSWAETFGMVVTEACAHGVPAVVSAGTGAEEALGEAGAACDPRDPRQWTARLGAWLDEPGLRRRWAETAHAQADRLPPWTRTAAAWQTLIRRVAG